MASRDLSTVPLKDMTRDEIMEHADKLYDDTVNLLELARMFASELKDLGHDEFTPVLDDFAGKLYATQRAMNLKS